MGCTLCNWLRNWLGTRTESACDRMGARIQDWESAHSNDGELWTWESEANLTLFEQASALHDADPEAAFSMYVQAAEAGSPWSLRMVGWHYHSGSVVAADRALALSYYYRAICAGSWMATIPYARLLAEEGRFDDSETVLQDGIDSGFVAASFALASLRFKRSKGRRTCREIRPLLEYAAEQGHPGAKQFLAALMLLGKYGLRQIPAGLRMAWKSVGKDDDEEQAGAATRAPTHPGAQWLHKTLQPS